MRFNFWFQTCRKCKGRNKRWWQATRLWETIRFLEWNEKISKKIATCPTRKFSSKWHVLRGESQRFKTLSNFWRVRGSLIAVRLWDFDEIKKERSVNTDEVYKNLLERMRNKPPKSDPTRLVKGDDFKIVGGQDVTNHTWPFLVNIGNFCMGSIIGK